MGKSKGYWQPSIDESDSKKSYYDDYDYGYGYGYGYGKSEKRKYSSYNWEPTAWSFWGTNSLAQDDDNSKLFVKDPVSYVTPLNIDIKKKCTAWKKDSLNTIKELARVCYLKMVDEKDYISELYQDYDSLSDSSKQDYDVKKVLYDSIYEKYIPGHTPLEQAIAIYNQISNVNEYAERGEDDNENLDYNTTLDFDRNVYADADINEQLDFNELSKERKMDVLNKISVIGQLGEQFKVEKEVDEKIVSNSDTYARKIMRDYAQFSNIELYQKMLPNFRTKLLTKNLTVNIPVDRKEKSQKIIILLDFSGSMQTDQKQIWVNAILIDRLRYVMKEEAEVYFSYFVYRTEALKFYHLKNREDVMKFWTWFSNAPNGGTTDIGKMVDYVGKQINEHKLLHNLKIDLSEEKPEILIINDGEDSIREDSFPYKTNAITLMNHNEKFKDLCVASGGKCVNVDYDDSVKCYSEGKIEMLNDGKKYKKSY